MLYEVITNKPNESVTVADSGLLSITDDKKYMVLTLFDGVNYQEVKPERGSDKDNYAYRRNSFDEQTIRVKTRGFVV